ncbi:MAG: RelA/SpoT family protein [archaeon]|nr:RelA/SpoT family protein [Nanoarchaeota archaeon]
MDIQSFFRFLDTKDYSDKDITKFEEGIIFAREILSDKKRLAGDDYFDHSLRVAKILAENGAAPELILAAIIHGTSKYKTDQEIKEKFGQDVLSLVKGVDEITTIRKRNIKLTAETIRKVLLATVNDVRVIFIKLADKLDNQRDIDALPKDEQIRISQEVLDIYAPLAYRLGMERIRTELEDLAFKAINRKKFQEIADFLETSREERDDDVNEAIDKIKSLKNVEFIDVKGRSKHIYSIYKKVVKKGKRLQDIYDFLGIRVVVKTINDCYAVLGFLHENFEPIEGRLKDYISHPKPNGYQSIHTALKWKGNKFLEVQIRTKEMDDIAEEGLAAHWRYKGLKSDFDFEKRMEWMKDILSLQKDASAREFLENVKIDVFNDQIYCYTPKGDVKYLPLGATVLDFAYIVHEEVGNRTVGANVNGKFVPLRTQLKKGDVIEVLTSKKQLPRRNWLKFVISSRAKQKIRKGVKKYQKLPALHYRILKPQVMEEYETLVYSPEFKQASCVLARCCYPVPCDEIVGLVTKRRLISVHKKECEQIEKEEERWVKVSWKDTLSKNFKFYVVAGNRSGLLADLLHTIVNAKFEVREAKAKLLGQDSECSFVIVPKEMELIEVLVNRLLKLKGIKRIFFE